MAGDGQRPLGLGYPKAAGRADLLPRTDAPFGDEDYLDTPRTHTSVVRRDTTQGMLPVRSTSPNTTGSIPLRRQAGSGTGTGGTRGLPLQRQTRTTMPQARPPQKEAGKVRKRVHWLLPLGVGMIAMLVLWMVGASVVAWGIQRYNDYRYGNPRTYQTDAVVGHNDSVKHPSHFIAVNLNRQAVVIELMGGDPAKSVSYVAPVYIAGNGGELAPVTLEFRDVTSDKKPDMIIHIQLPGQDQIFIFINEGTKFRPTGSNDKLGI